MQNSNFISNFFQNVYTEGILGALFGIVLYLFGTPDNLLIALIAMIIIDILTGIVKAIALRQVASNRMLIGGARKFGMVCIVVVANVLDSVFEIGGILRTLTISYFIANEGVSILENWSLLGLPIPKKLREVLAALHEKEKDENGKEIEPKTQAKAGTQTESMQSVDNETENIESQKEE